MSLSRLRHDLVGASAAHRVFVLLAVVAALVVGLLAMHTINTFASHSMSMSDAVSSDAVPSNELLSNMAGHDEVAFGSATRVGEVAFGSATVVGAMVGMLHGESTDPMAAMACVLAILFTVIALVTVRGAVIAARLAPRDGVAAAMEVDWGASADHPPPDIHVLSISRV